MTKEIKLLKEIADITSCTTGDDLSEKDAQNILNIIENQQKEIEELQKYMKTNLIPKSTINLLYISKDKIKQLLKEKEKQYEIYVGREYSGMVELVAEIKILEKVLGE